MAIWTAEIKELEKLYESLKGQLPDLEKELERLVKADDENMILLYSRRCLEVIITDLCESELKRDRGTEPLKGIIDKLNKEKKVPSNIIISMDHLNSLSAYGAHPKDFDPEQVKPVLNNLSTIIKWYLKYKEHRTDIKTKPSEETRQEIKSTENVKKDITISRKRLAGILVGSIGIIASVFAVLYFSNIIGGSKQTKEIEKSIAVLPFLNESPVDTNKYFINGIMGEVLINLQSIKDFRVLPSTSTDQYGGRDRPTISEIAKKLEVSYIVAGSGQKYGNAFRLRVQLIKAKGKETQLWANSFEQELKGTTGLFNVQSQIAQAIAAELKAIITPEEKQIIEKVPTSSLMAHELYLMGNEEQSKYTSSKPFTRVSLERANELYKKALEYDPSYAQAYVGIAQVYWSKHYWETIMSENFLDSVRILADTALFYDDQLSEAYRIKGDYYRQLGDNKKAVQEFDKAIKFNPNDGLAYYNRAKIMSYNNYDFIRSIEDYQTAMSLIPEFQLPDLLRNFSMAYIHIGFIEKAKYYIQEAFKLGRDSLLYYGNLAETEFYNENFGKAVEFRLKAHTIDTSDIETYYRLGETYMFTGQYEESLKYFKSWLERAKTQSDLTLFGTHRAGWAYWQNGYKKEAEFYLNKQIDYCNRLKEIGRYYNPIRPVYDLASVYSFMGYRKKAYENLRVWAKMTVYPLWCLTFLKNDPFFNNIRNEPEFQQILRDVEAKYQAEHERVRKWLEETGQL